ncbi:PhzF family phenazine biosynthesis protein [Pseudenhygromyxa sp. WMMC2535]|nr:PhzF family phenazine biosynthesis protein [Pseudenhygromyxa sp. WMMC2535]
MLGLEARKPEGVPMFQVDAFCDGGPFTGNPAAVCLLDTWPEDATLQAVAAENNLSETAFLRCPDPVEAPARWELRWFTPSVEVELCGHATLAAGCVLLEEVARELDEVRFSSASGELCVRKDKDSHALTVELPLGTSAEQPAPAGLLAALGLAPEAVVEQRRAAAGTWLVVVGDEAEVRGLAPDMRALAAVPPGEVIVSAPAGPDSPGCDFVSRFFGPGVGIDEDPVTGSAHCVLAPYWAERLGKATLRARQLSTRGGTLEVAIEDRRVALTGRCAVVLRGALTRCGMR